MCGSGWSASIFCRSKIVVCIPCLGIEGEGFDALECIGVFCRDNMGVGGWLEWS